MSIDYITLQSIIDWFKKFENAKVLDKKHSYAIETLLSAYEKQQKEIEYLKSQIPIDKIFYYSYKDFISKDKIKAILEKYKYTEIGNSEKIIEFYKVLQSLLEEKEE